MVRPLHILSVFIFLAACNSSSNEKNLDCSKFKTGTFRYLGKQSGHFYIIKRTDSTQTEINTTTGSTTNLKIRWTSPCSYELTYLSRQSSPTDTMSYLNTDLVLLTEIIDTGKDYCVFSSKAKGMDKTLIDTLRLLTQ